MLKIATWNVNSLPVRLEQVLDWLQHSEVDVLGVQETKVTDDKFPKTIFESLGYHVTFSGQKTYNGMALISRHPIESVITALPNFEDEQKRVLAATIQGVRVINLYVPNGSVVGSEKYQYKLSWLMALQDFLKAQLNDYPDCVVMGDFNIAPEDRDVHDPNAWIGNVLVSPQEREAFASILSLGFSDGFRLFEQAAGCYSWWDYRQAAFRRDLGLRIDHILISDALKPRCQSVVIDKGPRGNERPSDHTPVFVTLM